MFFLAGLEQTGGDIQDWVVGLIGRPNNIPDDMIGICRAMVSKSPVVFVDLDQPLESFTDAFGAVFDTLAISHLFGNKEEDIIDRISWNSLWLTENGIATYLLPPARARRLRHNSTCPDTAILPLSGHPLIGRPPYLSNCSSRILKHDAASYLRVRARLQATFSNYHEMAVAKQIRRAERCHIIVGTSLYRAGLITKHDEREAYSSLISGIRERSPRDLIVWKPHPRAQSGNHANDFPVITPNQPIPIEVMLPHDVNNVVVHSIASTTLLTASYMHKLQVKEVVSNIDIEKLPHVKFVQRFVRKTTQKSLG